MTKNKQFFNISKEMQIVRMPNGIKLISPNEQTQYRYHPHATMTNLSVDSLLQLPLSIYFLNNQGSTVLINEEGVKICGYESPKNAVGKSLEAVSSAHTASRLIYNCKLVMKQNEIKIIEELNERKDGKTQQFLSIKSPWYENDQMIGTCGFTILLGTHPLAESLQVLSNLGIFNSYQKRPQINRQPANLTKREHECYLLIIKGYTAKKIAYAMGISYRTVEEYINTIKSKLGVQTKSELLELAHSEI